MPDELKGPLEYQRHHTQLLREELLQRVEELSVSDYPAETPNQIIQFLLVFLGHLAEVINKAASEDRLRPLNSIIRELGVFLEWLDNAHTEQTPRGLVLILVDLIDRLVVGSKVVVRPQSQYNYSILDLGQILTKLVNDFIPHSKQGDFKEHLASPVKLISFPRIERDNILAHAIFGHELGHPTASEYLDAELNDADHIKYQHEIQKKVVEIVKKHLGPNPPAPQKLETETNVFKTILQVRKRALEELISDAVGVMIFGPSAVFALYELFWSANWDARPCNPEFYPPSRMRLRLMLALMDNLEVHKRLVELKSKAGCQPYVEAAENFMANMRTLTEVKTDDGAIAADPSLQIAYDWAFLNYDAAVEFAKKKVVAVLFDPERVFNELPELINRLSLGIPPNEVGDPAAPTVVDYRSSLMAAWMVKIHRVYSNGGNVMTGDETVSLYKKTLSAIEYVILQEHYNAHITSFDKP